MADAAVPAAPAGLSPSGSGLDNSGVGGWAESMTGFFSQPAVRRALPAVGAFAAILVAGLAYLSLAAGPSRVLYSNLDDGERAQVAEALDSGGITYEIDAGTGRISVAEDDIYRARMLVASNTGLAAPQSATDMLDNIPMGASRTMEGERLRLARERELMMTIQEIDGISSVRVHLATPERSVFVRDKSPATASVMVRLARGRSLGKEQVDAIVSLVAGSVPGLSPESVRVVDQNGRLLSTDSETVLDGLLLQSEFEAKLRDQVAQLLTPMLGEGKFSTEVQVALESSETTSARETYEPEGKIRSESETSSRRLNAGNAAGGVPGVVANTPPPPADLVEGAPNPDAAAAGAEAQNPPTDSETSARRNYELDREVAVTTSPSGRLTRISVAVAVDAEALKAIAPADEAKLQELVSAAVGADEGRGDVVNVMSSAFEDVTVEDPPFYEAGWFDMALRYGGAFLALIMLLIFGVRPMLKRLKQADVGADDDEDEDEEGEDEAIHAPALPGSSQDPQNASEVAAQVELARKLAIAQPERAVAALQRMLAAPPPTDDTSEKAEQAA